ncbi:MAG: hypothetical protein ABIH23_33790 [bacterium]
MRLKAHSPKLEGWEGFATVTTEHAVKSHSLPVLVVEGEAVGVLEATVAKYEIIEVSDRELRDLRRAGYLIRGV